MYLVSTGMVCSVGLNALSACAALRARIAGFHELPYCDNRGEPIIGAAVPILPPRLKRNERLIELAAMALADCLSNLSTESLVNIPLLIGLAESGRPGGGDGVTQTIIPELEQKLGIRFHPTLSQVIPEGHVSGFRALNVARQLFHSQGLPACLICGVDSYLNAQSLLWLNEHWRLKTEENSDGVIPGEGAAAVLLQAQSPSGAESGVKIAGIGFGHEEAGVLSEEPLLGLGLAAAARSALTEAGQQMHQMDFRLSDVTGESYGFKEQALMLGRLMRERRESLPIWHSADCIGDTGAAAGVGQLIVAQHAFRKRYAPGEQAIACTSAVPGGRAAVVLRQARPAAQ